MTFMHAFFIGLFHIFMMDFLEYMAERHAHFVEDEEGNTYKMFTLPSQLEYQLWGVGNKLVVISKFAFVAVGLLALIKEYTNV